MIVMVMDALGATGNQAPQALRSAHDRMAPMIRFFRHGDGALALFNGGTESDARMIAGLLARDEVRGQPFAHARHSGYQRLAAGRTHGAARLRPAAARRLFDERSCRMPRLRTERRRPAHRRQLRRGERLDPAQMGGCAAGDRRPFDASPSPIPRWASSSAPAGCATCWERAC